MKQDRHNGMLFSVNFKDRKNQFQFQSPFNPTSSSEELYFQFFFWVLMQQNVQISYGYPLRLAAWAKWPITLNILVYRCRINLQWLALWTPRGFVPPMSHQFRPVVPPPQSQQFIPVASQHFQPVARGATGLPSQTQQPQFPQLMQQLPARPGPPASEPCSTSSEPCSNPSEPSGSILPPSHVQAPNTYPPGLGGLGTFLCIIYLCTIFICSTTNTC
ncbi:hypothetical protein LWI29_010781 [Acer saccharum]|uniref:Uncharacterized protein n=1 Tax=Acer saccharum TaxID=4024 RepID=A0AA39RU79_ACESA|nr:hypothetical protein LWI29_010781 [Acer saccharum]